MFGGGSGEDAWKPFLTDAIAKQMTARGGIGLAVPVWHQMLRLQESNEEIARGPEPADAGRP
jgi:Rod binding domain-containing protein